MESRFDHYWTSRWSPSPLRHVLIISVMLHLFFLGVLYEVYHWQTRLPEPVVYQVQLFDTPGPPTPEATPAVTPPEPPKKEPPKPDPPKPDPPKPEVKPEPPKPEPPKPKPEPKPEPKPKVEEKKEPPKPEVKPEPPKPKPEPPKPEPPKKEVIKTDPKLDKLAMADELTPRKPTAAMSPNQVIDPKLGYWCKGVQRKVEKSWVIPAGIHFEVNENIAEVAFWIDRDGNLLGEPTIIKPAIDPELGESGVRAIKLAAPFPPLPEDYGESELYVVYSFGLAQ